MQTQKLNSHSDSVRFAHFDLFGEATAHALELLILVREWIYFKVTVYFNNKLMRGNRCVKMDNSGLNAFQSPNMDTLADMQIDIKGIKTGVSLQ